MKHVCHLMDGFLLPELVQYECEKETVYRSRHTRLNEIAQNSDWVYPHILTNELTLNASPVIILTAHDSVMPNVVAVCI